MLRLINFNSLNDLEEIKKHSRNKLLEFMFFLVYLDDTNHGLTMNFWIVVNDNVKAIVDGDNAVSSKCLHL